MSTPTYPTWKASFVSHQVSCQFEAKMSRDSCCAGNTPLMYCAMKGNDTGLKKLIRSFKRFEFDVNHVNEDGCTALILAAKEGCVWALISIQTKCTIMQVFKGCDVYDVAGTLLALRSSQKLPKRVLTSATLTQTRTPRSGRANLVVKLRKLCHFLVARMFTGSSSRADVTVVR